MINFIIGFICGTISIFLIKGIINIIENIKDKKIRKENKAKLLKRMNNILK